MLIVSLELDLRGLKQDLSSLQLRTWAFFYDSLLLSLTIKSSCLFWYLPRVTSQTKIKLTSFTVTVACALCRASCIVVPWVFICGDFHTEISIHVQVASCPFCRQVFTREHIHTHIASVHNMKPKSIVATTRPPGELSAWSTSLSWDVIAIDLSQLAPFLLNKNFCY